MGFGYNGRSNYATWNVILWLSNDFILYNAMQGFKTYATPFRSFRQELKDSVGYTETKDGISLWNPILNIAEINEFIRSEDSMKPFVDGLADYSIAYT